MIKDGDEILVAICFWSSGDWRREDVAFSFLVKRVAAAPFFTRTNSRGRGVGSGYFIRKNFSASSMSAGIGAVNFTFFPVRGWMNASLWAWSKTRGAS